MNILSLVQTALELGLICSLTVLALFLSYSMLNVCDLSTDGCFTLGAAVGAMVAIAGHPYLAILAAMGAGVLSGFITALLHWCRSGRMPGLWTYQNKERRQVYEKHTLKKTHCGCIAGRGVSC